MVSLICHPNTPAEADVRVSATAERLGDDLYLRYHVEGEIGDLRLPPPIGGERLDELWKSTCFEAFLRRPEQTCYREFNFSPSHDWAAYQFDDYRSGMSQLDIVAPASSSAHLQDRFTLSIAFRLSPAKWQLALTAVLEEQSGTKSYWALQHPAGPPDFHHPACFTLELPAPEPA